MEIVHGSTYADSEGNGPCTPLGLDRDRALHGTPVPTSSVAIDERHEVVYGVEDTVRNVLQPGCNHRDVVVHDVMFPKCDPESEDPVHESDSEEHDDRASLPETLHPFLVSVT